MTKNNVVGATSTSAASAAAMQPTTTKALMWIIVYPMMREYSTTTVDGSCAPQNTALPSMAGVKNGRPLTVSTMRNQTATAAAPMHPAMKPSRRIRLSCMAENIPRAGARARLEPMRRPTFYGLCLLVGSLLFAIAGLMHPLLTGDGAAQLATVAATESWRAIHWSLLFGFPLMYVGLVGVALRHGETPGSAPARAGMVLAAFGFGVWTLNVLFMAGAGWQLARAYATADTRLAGPPAVFVYPILHSPV